MASQNSSVLGLNEPSLNNITSPAAPDQTLFEKLGDLPTILLQHKDLLALEARIIFTALACIYIGSHGSLRRPPSAKSPKKGKEKEDEDNENQYVQGLRPSDTIMLPFLAGGTLIGLYYLIKWLEDPNILNNILRVYFSVMSLASLGKLFSDGLHFLTSFVFPSIWLSRDGKIYHVDSEKRGQWYAKDATDDRVWDPKKVSPLPSIFSGLRLPDATTKLLWEIRHLSMEEWTVRFAIHGIINETAKVRFNDIFGAVLALGANAFYYTTESVFFSNIMGYAFSYAGIMLMSPTTFATGSSVLFGLFFYDIVMVFYT